MPPVIASTDLMSPLSLFLHADLVVKLVMLGLLAASVWTWAIIFTHSIRLRRLRRAGAAFERDFWASDDVDGFAAKRGSDKLPNAAIVTAGLDEWRRSARLRNADHGGTRERLSGAMNSAIATELDRLSDRLNILATVGAGAPFVGLFGTVWGIMRSFSAIAISKNTNLSVVAPGIAEALFATAIGLVAAIPAVLAYNKLSSDLSRFAARLEGFGAEFGAILSRQSEERG